VDLLPFLQWNLNNIYIRSIGMSLYKYLFNFKFELSVDRLITVFRILEDILERRFMREHLRKDAQFAMDQANTFVKRYYNSKHHWEEFEVGD